MAWTYAATQAGYRNLWNKIAIKQSDAADTDRFARKIIAAEARYKKTEASTGVPWFFIGALHMRESACNFAGVLHNGEHIIGTGKKTRLVPKGRGPFSSWEAAAVDALRLKNLHKVTDWNVSRMGFEAERYNGLGYTKKGVNSAYLWAGSNLEQRGKYIADGVWGSNADDKQIGVMTVLKRLAELRPDVAARISGAPVIVPLPKPKTEEAAKAGTAAAGGGAVVAGGAAVAVQQGVSAMEILLWIGGLSLAAAILILIAYRLIKGTWPWSSTGEVSLDLSLPTPPRSGLSSALASARSALQSAALQEASSPQPSVSRKPRKLSAKRSRKTLTQPKSSPASKQSRARKSSPKRKSR